jgi:Right handed beta helix region
MMWKTVVVAVAIAIIGFMGGFVAEGAPPDDSTAALQARFDQLRPGDTLTLDRQTYLHSGVLQIRVPAVRIDGNGATLLATNDETSSVQIEAAGVSLANLNLTASLAGERWTGLNQHKLVVAANDVTVTNVTITGSAGAGVFVDAANNFQLDRVTVRDTRADGIHVTGGSSNGRVNNPTTEQTGDDGVAVVSYTDDPEPCRNIVVNSPLVNGTRWGRGVSVVGGENISLRNLKVSQTSGAGVYIASEGGPQFYTRSVNAVDVSGGSVTAANVNPSVVQGAVLVYAGNARQSVSNVTVSNLIISSTAAPAGFNVGLVVDGGGIGNITFRDIQLQRTDLPAVYSNAPQNSYIASGFTMDGRPTNS